MALRESIVALQGRIEKSFWAKALLAAGCGCLLFLSCADFDIWPLAYLGFVPLLLAVRASTPRRAFLWGWLAGTVANAGGFYWITILLMRFGRMGWLPAVALFLLLVAYQGLHWGAFCYLIRRVRGGGVALPMTLLAPVLMTALELVMPFIFDWYLAITQAWIVPVIQVADLTGPLGVTFLIMLVNGMLYDALERGVLDEPRQLPWRPIAAGAAVLAAALIYGAVRIGQIDARRAAAPRVKIGVVQANIGIVTKGIARLAPIHHRIHLEHTRELQRRGAQLVVWPESSYPYALDRDRWQDFPPGDPRRIMDGIEVPVLFGALSYGGGSQFPHNTAYMMRPDGRITGRFDKNFLLVFGEYIPFYEHIPSFRRWFPAASHFARGNEVTTFQFKGQRIGPMICYEDILPSFGRRLAKLKPNLLVNVTNDAWFGSTSEPYEHMALSVYRAVELRLDMVRAVNTGVSVFIDAAGRVGRQTKSYDPVVQPDVKPVTLLGESVFLPGGETVYAAVGDLFGWLNLAGVCALLGLVQWRARRSGGAPHKQDKKEPSTSGRGKGRRRKRRR